MLAPILLAAMSSSCNGVDLAITSTKSLGAQTDAQGLSTYHVAVTVTNLGHAGQPGNAIDSVAMYVDGTKTDVKGLNPLAAGAMQKVVFVVQRNQDGQMGSTPLRFAITPHDACNVPNDAMSITI